MSLDDRVLVLEFGSSTTYAGEAGADAPSLVFETCIGSPKYSPTMITDTMRSSYIGDDALKLEGILNLNYPIQHGVIKNWDLMEILLDYTLQELNSSQFNNSVLFINSIFEPVRQRNELIQLFFEKYQFQGFSQGPQPIMATYACGITTALSVCVGEGVIQVVPCYWGFSHHKSMRRANFGAGNVTDYMIKMLSENHGISLENNRRIVKEMNRKIGYISCEYEKDLEKSQQGIKGNQSYELPDGQLLDLSHEHFTCNEILFNPSLVGFENLGIVDMIYDSIQASDIDTRATFYNNIIISGGTTLIPGMRERIEHDMREMIPKSKKLCIVAAPERRYSSWIGGSIAGSLNAFWEMAIEKREYEEYGCNIIERKKIGTFFIK